jgi:predicted MFS family arabinose efflux permease
MSDAGGARGAMFASLGVRNYRLFWTGQLVSQVGTWLSLTAVSWMVLTELGGGGTAIGFLAAAQFLPTLVFGTAGGVLADRSDLRRMLFVTQPALLCSATLLATLKAAGVIELWMVFPLVSLQGLGLAFDNPARQAFVSELVGPDLVPNAVALNSASMNGARIVGPALAGLVIQFSGTGACFALNAVSYLAVLGGLAAMHRGSLHPRRPAPRAKGQVREGLRYARDVPILRSALLTMAVVGTVAMNFTVIVPLLARTTFDTSAGTFGLLSTSMGAGSLVGSLRVARNVEPTLATIGKAATALGVAMLAAAASPTLPVAMAALAVAGACVMTFAATTNSVLQLNARSDMRGRVLSLYLVLFIGTSPFGSPIVGWVAQHFGTRLSVVYGATGALAGGAFAWRRRHVGAEPKGALV